MLKKVFRTAATLGGCIVGYGAYYLTKILCEKAGNDFFSTIKGWQNLLIEIAFILLFGLLFFFIVAPVINTQSRKVARGIESDLQKFSSGEIIMATVGMLIGIMIAYLLSNVYTLIKIPYVPLILSIITYLLFGYLGIVIGQKQGFSLVDLIKNGRKKEASSGKSSKKKYATPKIIDTSVIIDGRIADIMNTGFLEGKIIIPDFVLVELRHIADSSDSLKRVRGRRGLDILNKIKEEHGVEIHDTKGEKGLAEIPEVDVKLLKLAQNMNGKVVTNDYNLNKVAGVNGVPVLNINELANTLKPIVIPGEKMTVLIVNEGKERNQGVAYLDDGTMIVVEDGKKLIGKTTDVVVSSVLQTSAGRMIFARPVM